MAVVCAVLFGTKRTPRILKTGFVTAECVSGGRAAWYRPTRFCLRRIFDLRRASPSTICLPLDLNADSVAIAGRPWFFDQSIKIGFPSRLGHWMIRKSRHRQGITVSKGRSAGLKRMTICLKCPRKTKSMFPAYEIDL